MIHVNLCQTVPTATKLLLGDTRHLSSRSRVGVTARAVTFLQGCSGLQSCAVRHNAELDISPKVDRKLSRECHDPDFAASRSCFSESFPPPKRQCAVWLVSQPEPGQFHQCQTSELGPGLVDPAISRSLTAGIGARRKTQERCEMTSVLEVPVKDLCHQDRGGDFTNTTHLSQTLNLLGLGGTSRGTAVQYGAPHRSRRSVP